LFSWKQVYILLPFRSITQRDILYKNCSNIPSHLLTISAIIGRLKNVFISALNISFLITLSAVFQFLTFAIPVCQIHQYGEPSVIVIASTWRVHWLKVLRVTLDFNDQIRRYNFLIFPLILIRQKYVTLRYRRQCMCLWTCWLFIFIFMPFYFLNFHFYELM
jgi:hypothetical protein